MRKYRKKQGVKLHKIDSSLMRELYNETKEK